MPLVLVFGGFTSFETLAKLRRVYRHHLSSVQNLLSDISFYWLVHDGILTMVYYHPYQNDPHFTPCINNTQQAGSTAHCLIWHWHHPMVRKSSPGPHLCVLQLFQGLSQLLLQGPSFLIKPPGCHQRNLWQFWWFWRVSFCAKKDIQISKSCKSIHNIAVPTSTIKNNHKQF